MVTTLLNFHILCLMTIHAVFSRRFESNSMSSYRIRVINILASQLKLPFLSRVD